MRKRIAPLIDAKGRLFGRLNIVDAGAVTVVVVMGYGLFLATQIMSGRLRRDPPPTAATVGPVIVHARVLLKELDRERVGQIRVGDSERDEKNRTVATIVRVGKPKPDFVQVAVGNITVEAVHGTLFRLPVTMDLIGEARGGTFFFQGRLIGPESPIVFRTPSYRVTGLLVTAFPVSGYTMKAEREKDELSAENQEVVAKKSSQPIGVGVAQERVHRKVGQQRVERSKDGIGGMVQ